MDIMKAEKMFEEIGYEEEDVSNMYVGNGCVMVYVKCGNFTTELIEFYKTGEVLKIDECGHACHITMQELKAIRKQCKELKWIR